MKNVLTALFVIVFGLGAWLQATTKTDPVVRTGYFGGELSCYASGDTVMYVYFDTDQAADVPLRYAKFCISTDAGETWQESIIPQALDTRTRPTLTVLSDRIVVSLAQYRYKTVDLGQSWNLESSYYSIMESTPKVFKRGNELAEFRTKQVFPEWEQFDFTIGGTEDIEFPILNNFVDNDISTNDTNVYWSGNNVVTGVLGSRGDIKIKQAGGGNNNGWPTFLEKVVIGGNVISSPSNYPVDQVFQGGLYEDRNLSYLPIDNPIRTDGVQMGEGQGHIYMITVDQGTYSGWHGIITPPRRVHTDVYSEYPPDANSQILYTNHYTVSDTVWTPYGGGVCHNRSFMVNGELWIKGNFLGKQTWAASGDIKIIGDITYNSTAPNSSPADNFYDMVNLISEKNIVIKYGYKDPANSVRYHPFCGADNTPHQIYANLYALGNEPRTGVFTFEYQHPHPSTPAVMYEDEYYDNIDLHRRPYPPTAANPWPANLDLPWYNPLWPEKNPILERGTINMWGSIYQRKHGYLHRTHNDTEYPSNSGIWNVDLDMCGGPTNPVAFPDPVLGDDLVLQGMNYPGAAGSGVGYKMNYNADPRNYHEMGMDEVYNKVWQFGISIMVGGMPSFFHDRYAVFNEALMSKSMDNRDGVYAFAANEALLLDTGQNYMRNLSSVTQGKGTILNVQISNNGLPVVHQYRILENGDGISEISEISNPNPPNPPGILASYTFVSDPDQIRDGFCITPLGRKILARKESTWLVCHEILVDGTLLELGRCEIGNLNGNGSRIHLIPSDEDNINLFVWENLGAVPRYSIGNIHHFKVQLSVSNQDNTIPEASPFYFSTYPNPASNILNLEYKLPPHDSHQVDVFNIKGEMVYSYRANGDKNARDYKREWDLRNQNRIPSGIYILRLKVDDKEYSRKRISIF